MATTARDAAALVERYIEPSPHKPGEAEVRLREYGIAVWAIIDYWYGVDFDKSIVARDFDIPTELVDAALAYYKAHKTAVDARITLAIA